jgi:hypothetical protein
MVDKLSGIAGNYKRVHGDFTKDTHHFRPGLKATVPPSPTDEDHLHKNKTIAVRHKSTRQIVLR